MVMVVKGVYCLCIAVKEDLCLQTGVLGRIKFLEGSYIYVGSALNGLNARIIRHLNTSKGIYKAIHWHIDYLLREKSVSVDAVYVRLSDQKIECGIAAKVSGYGSSVKNFGSSDCRCQSHLFTMESWSFLPDLNMKKWETVSVHRT